MGRLEAPHARSVAPHRRRAHRRASHTPLRSALALSRPRLSEDPACKVGYTAPDIGRSLLSIAGWQSHTARTATVACLAASCQRPPRCDRERRDRPEWVGAKSNGLPPTGSLSTGGGCLPGRSSLLALGPLDLWDPADGRALGRWLLARESVSLFRGALNRTFFSPSKLGCPGVGDILGGNFGCSQREAVSRR